MNENAFDRLLADWLEEGPDRGPAEGLQQALLAIRAVPQRSRWAFVGAWIPMPQTIARPRVSAFAGSGLLVVMLAAVLATSAIFIGSRPRLPAPVGPAANGLIAGHDKEGIWVGRLDGSERRLVSRVPGFSPPIGASPVFSPDGTRLAFLSNVADGPLDSRIFIVPVDGSHAPLEVSGEFRVAAGYYPIVAWSPDGTRIAFTGSRHGFRTIIVAATDGSGARAVTDDAADRDVPSWSPDGDRLAYRISQRGGTRPSLAIARADGSGEAILTTVAGRDASLSIGRWSPDGERLAYYANDGSGEKAMIVDLSGNVASLWPEPAGAWLDNGIPWSPDGRTLALLTPRDGVVLIDPDGTNPRRLGKHANCWIEWSPDGTALYGGGPDFCTLGALIPVADPESATMTELQGAGSWQRVAP